MAEFYCRGGPLRLEKKEKNRCEELTKGSTCLTNRRSIKPNCPPSRKRLLEGKEKKKGRKHRCKRIRPQSTCGKKEKKITSLTKTRRVLRKGKKTPKNKKLKE